MHEWFDEKYFFDILKEIDMPEEMTAALTKVPDKAKTELIYGIYDELIHKDNYATFAEKMKVLANDSDKNSGLTALTIYLIATKTTWGNYKKAGISHEIFIDTIKCLKRFSDEYKFRTGTLGFDEFYCIWKRIKCRIFRLGRLEFEILKWDRKDLYDNAECYVKNGEYVLNIHIPSGEKLLHEDCIASYQFAEHFFKNYFPQYTFKQRVCYSWLLGSWLKNILTPETGIIQFQNDFKLLEEDENNISVIKRVFGKYYDNPSDYPENTSLERSIRNMLMNGQPLTVGLGVLNESVSN